MTAPETEPLSAYLLRLAPADDAEMEAALTARAIGWAEANEVRRAIGLLRRALIALEIPETD